MKKLENLAKEIHDISNAERKFSLTILQTEEGCNTSVTGTSTDLIAALCASMEQDERFFDICLTAVGVIINEKEKEGNKND